VAETFDASALYSIAMLSLFELIGGLVLGSTMQKIAGSGFLPRMILSQAFLVIWGIMFAGIPLLIGGSSFGLTSFLIQSAVLICAWVSGFLFLDQIRAIVALPWLWFVGFGGLFATAGAAAAFLAANQDPALALVLGISFGGVGTIFLVIGLAMMRGAQKARKEPDE